MNTRKLSSVVTVSFKTLVRVAVQALTVKEAFNPVTPKTRLSIRPSSCYTFPCKLSTRIWC